MSKPMTAFTTDFQHSGMVAKDLDETIASTPRSSALSRWHLPQRREPLRLPALRPPDHRDLGGRAGPDDRRCHQPLGFRHPRTSKRPSKRQGTRPEVQGHRDPAHRQLLGARHPLLQRVRSERRDHRVLPDRLIVRLIKTRGSHPQQRDGNAPRLVYVLHTRFSRVMQTHIARVPSHFRVADVRDVGLHESQRGADDVLVFHAQALAQREAGVVERAFLID